MYLREYIETNYEHANDQLGRFCTRLRIFDEAKGELIQETWRLACEYKSEVLGDPMKLLRTIMYNRFLRARNKSWETNRLSGVFNGVEFYDIEDRYEPPLCFPRQEDVVYVKEIYNNINDLSIPQQRVLELVAEEYSVGEIANTLRKSHRATEQLLYKARQILRQLSGHESPKRKTNTVPYRGVSHSYGTKWKSQISLAGHKGSRGRKFIGSFDTPEEAAIAYDREAIKRFGQKAKLNFPTAVTAIRPPEPERAR